MEIMALPIQPTGGECQANRKPGRCWSGAGGSYQTVTTMQGPVPAPGFSLTAATTVSVLMMEAAPRFSSQALICSSISLVLVSIKILIFRGLGICSSPSASWESSRSKSSDAAVQIRVVGTFDSGADDVANAERPA